MLHPDPPVATSLDMVFANYEQSHLNDTYPRYNSGAEVNLPISCKRKLAPLKMEVRRPTIALDKTGVS